MSKVRSSGSIRRGFSIMLLVLGAGLVFVSVSAEIIGLDFTDGFGIVQIAQLLAGLTCLTLVGFIRSAPANEESARSLQADIGLRLGATGLVFAYIAGFSDLLQVGTHLQPDFERPFIGPIQLFGIIISILIIVIGMVLYHTSSNVRTTSSLEFLIPENGEGDEESE